MRSRALRTVLLLALLCVPAVAVPGCGDREPQRAARGAARRDGPPNVLLIVIDTLRRDALEPSLAGRCDMPALARRTREATWFAQASSSSSWTVPALGSLLTGLAPHEHRLLDLQDVGPHFMRLSSLPELLPEGLRYRRGAFFGGLPPSLRDVLGQGFDTVQDDFVLQRGPETLGPWLAQAPPDAPWLLLLHTYEAHDPYGAANHPPLRVRAGAADVASLDALGPEPASVDLVRRAWLDAGQRDAIRSLPRFAPHAERVNRYAWAGEGGTIDAALCEDLVTAYRRGVRWVDEQLERTLAWLDEAGHLENTLWIVTADHGEAFGEHGMLGHGRRLDEELVRIPLVIGGVTPFTRPSTITASVGIVDLLPTLLARVGAPVPAGLDGVSLLDVVARPSAGHPVVSEVRRTSLHTGGLAEAECLAVRSGTWKWVATWDRMAQRIEESCYDLLADPHERTDLLPARAQQPRAPDRAACEAIERARARLRERVPAGTPGFPAAQACDSAR